jgi:hypothetical protein
MATKADVAAVAEQAQAQRLAGDSTWTHNKVVFHLNETGACARFVRQCHEAALGTGEFTWQFIAGNARQMEAKLKAAKTAIASPQPGDVVAMNNVSADAGHVGIYLGDVNGVESIAENTSSSKRGNPRAAGTKISPLSAVKTEITGYYAPMPAAAADAHAPGPIKVELEGDGSVDGWFTDHSIVGVAHLAGLLGYTVEDRVRQDRKVILHKQP